jgi:hypothetical protein
MLWNQLQFQYFSLPAKSSFQSAAAYLMPDFEELMFLPCNTHLQ